MAERIALITGASSGIGEALARELAGRGYSLSLLARRKERLERLRAELGSGGREVLAIGCDVSRDGDVEAAVEQTLSAFGRLDVVIANAGIGVGGTFSEMTLDDYRRVMETNFFGVIRLGKAALSALKESRGSFVGVGSVNGYLAMPGFSAYCASKYALRGLLETMRAELLPAGVSVTHIAPGFVESEIRLLDNSGHMKADAKDTAPAWLVMPAKKAARDIADAIEARKREAVITGHGKLAVVLAKHCSGLMAFGARRSGQKMYDRLMRK